MTSSAFPSLRNKPKTKEVSLLIFLKEREYTLNYRGFRFVTSGVYFLGSTGVLEPLGVQGTAPPKQHR